jgi:hypothetical protein
MTVGPAQHPPGRLTCRVEPGYTEESDSFAVASVAGLTHFAARHLSFTFPCSSSRVLVIYGHVPIDTDRSITQSPAEHTFGAGFFRVVIK